MVSKFKNVRVLYATATGTAEDVARDISHRFQLCGTLVACCAPVDSYAFDALLVDAADGALFVFIVATSGDGEAPQTMTRLWTILRNAALRPGVLAAVRFAVFGLGDRSYPKFNAAARRLTTRMRDLGAVSMVSLGLGDEADPRGYDAELRPWIDALFAEVVPNYSSLSLPSPLPPPRPRLQLSLRKEFDSTGHKNTPNDPSAAGKWEPGQAPNCLRTSAGSLIQVVEARVIKNSVLTNPEELEDDREVRNIELNVDPRDTWSTGNPDSEFYGYVPGDVVHVLPRNRSSSVQAFLELTGLDGDAVIDAWLSNGLISEESASKNMFSLLGASNLRGSEAKSLNIRTPCFVDAFVSAQLDLNAAPRRRFFERLAGFATDAMQRGKLLELSSPDGAADLVQYVFRERRTILMVLRDFPSARPPLEHLIDMIPSLRPRAFSIASSRHAHGSTVHICAAIVRYTTPLRFLRVGVCSSLWLGAAVGDTIPVYLEHGTLRFNSNCPAILVGPGTGVAPMRSFMSSLDVPVANGTRADIFRFLYFGCRHASGDYLYRDEWQRALALGVLTKLTAACSRDGPKKIYVQDKMLEDRQELWSALQDGGLVYIAGAAGNMPKGVRLALVNIAVSEGGYSEKDAETYVKALERSHRLQIECW
jgi:sulfite reductase alpha subunit-like flavoprotein